MSNLDELQSSLLSLLGDKDNTDGWSAATTEEAIRLGLRVYSERAPWIYKRMTMDETISELSLGAEGVLEVSMIYYDWDLEDIPDESNIVWWLWDATTIMTEEPMESGKSVLLRCRAAYEIEDLGGADHTTLSASQEETMLLAAAHHAYLLRVRQLAHLPSSPPVEIETYEKLAGKYWTKFEQSLTAPMTGSIVWSNIGL